MELFPDIFTVTVNASQSAENVNNIYDPDTVIAKHAQFLARLLRSGNFNLENALLLFWPLNGQLPKISVK